MYCVSRISAALSMISALVVTAAAVGLSGCASPKPPAASHPSSAAPSAATGDTASAAGLGPASRTTCGDFKNMDNDAEKEVVTNVLAENPGSKFDASPNVALGTAKLVCLSSSRATVPIAIAIGVVNHPHN